VLPSTIKTTMWCFVGVVVLELVAGSIMIAKQNKYGTDEERQLKASSAEA